MVPAGTGMARKNLSDALLERLIRKQNWLKYQIEQSRIVAVGVNSPFWKAYRKMMQDKLDRCESELFNSEPAITNEKLRNLVTTIRNLKMFISGPSDFEKSIDAMEDKLEKIKAEIDERKSKL